MTRYVGLLRAVNVGGRKVTMAELKVAATKLGYENARTLVASGNLVFDAKKAAPAKLESALEGAIEKTFGLFSDVMVRDPAEWAAILKANPFPKKAKDDPAHLVVNFLAGPPTADDKAALAVKWDGPETWKLVGSEVFICYPAGMGPSKLKLKLKTRATGRNWNVVTALAKLAAESG